MNDNSSCVLIGDQDVVTGVTNVSMNSNQRLISEASLPKTAANFSKMKKGLYIGSPKKKMPAFIHTQ